MRDRLIELIDNAVIGRGTYLKDGRLVDVCGEKAVDKITAIALADYLLANGVIVPPCKVGDTVYCIEHKTIHECIVKLVKSLTYENETIFFVESECEIVNPFYSDGRKMKHGIMAVWEVEYGSWYRAFLTKEAAEQVLKGGAE